MEPCSTRKSANKKEHGRMERKLAYLHTLRRTAITVVLLVLCLPLFAQYNIKKLMDEGRSSLDNGYYVVAMQIFQRVVGLRPDKNEAWYLSGVSKYHLDDYKGAESDCTRAIDLNPFFVDYFELRAMSRLREEKYDSAVTDFTRAIEMNPDNKDYWYNRAYCYAQVNAYDIAKRQLEYILKRWPNFTSAINLRQTILSTERLYKRKKDDKISSKSR